MWSTGRIMKWWCRLTVRWWTPGSSTSKAPPFLLTSVISRGIKPTPFLVPLQQPQRQPMLSAPSLSHYNSTLGLHGKTENGTLLDWRVGERSASFCLLGGKQRTTSWYNSRKKRKTKLLCFFLQSTHLLGKHWNSDTGEQHFSNGTHYPTSSTVAWWRFFSIPS